MNLKHMKVSLFEISYNKLFHDIIIFFLDVPVFKLLIFTSIVIICKLSLNDLHKLKCLSVNLS